MERTKRKGRLNWFALALGTLGIGFTYYFVSQTFELASIQRQCQIEQVKLQEAQKIQQDLALERDRLNTKEYIEKVAREELGLVKSGEVPYLSARQP